MNKKTIIVLLASILLTLLVIPIVLALSLYALLFNNSYQREIKTKDQWVSLLNHNETEFNEFANRFYKQENYEKIGFQDTAQCDTDKSIQNCTLFATKKGEYNLYGEKSIKVIEEYDEEYTGFMKKYNILLVSKFSPNSIQILDGNFGLCGLAYVPNGKPPEKDFEYTEVTHLKDKWYYICHDWN